MAILLYHKEKEGKVQKGRRLFVLFVIVVFLSGCSMLGQATTPETAQSGFPSGKNLSPLAKTNLMLHVWNKEFADTMALATKPSLTDIEKGTVKTKKAVLVKSKPLIDAYVTLVMNGGVPTQQQEDTIVALINSIGGVLWTQ